MIHQKQIAISGIKPTGILHLGNYFGAVKQFVDLQDKYEGYYFIADMHALTSVKDGVSLRENSLNVAIDYLALGIDPQKVTLYKQSDVPEVAELGWVFNCITTMPYLMRAHAFKDAEAKNKEINAGVFDYPVLMAADILIQQADVVPVGQDQKQHVEIARDIAEKFNLTFGDIFKMPEHLIIENVKTLPGTDGQKMSKSYGNIIPLFAEPDEMKKIVMSITTDSKGVGEPKDTETDNVFALHKLFSEKDLAEIERKYKEGGIGYKESKEILAGNMIEYLRPMRERRKEISSSRSAVLKILKEGGEKARERAVKTMKKVREKVGFDFTSN